MWRSIQHNNTTPLSRFLFFWNFTIGQTGQICFPEFLKIISCFFAQNFCTDRVDILLCSEANKKGGFSMKFGTFGPSKLVASATSTLATPTTPSLRRICVDYVIMHSEQIGSAIPRVRYSLTLGCRPWEWSKTCISHWWNVYSQNCFNAPEKVPLFMDVSDVLAICYGGE